MFSVLYRWRLKPGEEERFRAAWHGVTEKIMAARGGLGSRFLRADDGTHYAYAQWPSREAWQAHQNASPIDPAASAEMRACIEESFPAVPLAVVDDLLK